MLRAIREVRKQIGYYSNIVAYELLDESTGEKRVVDVTLIQKALQLNKVQIRNLELNFRGSVSFKGVTLDYMDTAIPMDEDDAWKYINKLNRTSVDTAAEELRELMMFKLPLDEAIKLCKAIRLLYRNLHIKSDDIMADFMRNFLKRCSDDQLTDFTYLIIWLGKDAYYKTLNSNNPYEMQDNLNKYLHKIKRNDGELFGYESACIINRM